MMNLKTEDKKVGMFGGKFNLHNGHIYAIYEASTMVDELYVVVSYIEERDKELAKQAGIKYANPKLRALWITQATKHIPNVKVLCVEDIPMDVGYTIDDVWALGAERIKQAIPEKITHVFSSENEYEPFFKANYEGAEHIVIDAERKNVPISSTKLREEGIYKIGI